MTRRVKRSLASVSYMLQKAYWKIVTAKPSVLIFAVVIVAASIFLLGGGVYDLLEKPIFAIFLESGRMIGVHPYYLNEQLLAESIFVMLVYAIGAGGFLLTYQSTKYAHRPRQAFMLLLIGIILIIFAYIGVEYAFLARWRLE